MSELAKARLQEIKSNRQGEEVGDPLEVQFNPASLQIKLSNTIEGGDSQKRQTRQYVGKSSTTLSFDLVFDTAEESDGSGEPLSVRTRTQLVEKYLLPKSEGNKEVPPKVRFLWGNLIFDGIISDLAVDFTLFSSGGVPLRAKMGVTIKEQDPEYQFLESGPGANQPGAGGGGDGDEPRPGDPGSSGSPSTDRSAPALAGESMADFAARQGLDPSRWRSLVPDGIDPLSLAAGLEIDFDASIALAAGIGIRAGIQAGVGVSVEASMGLSAGARAGASAGFALAAAGGVQAGLASVASARVDTATGKAKAAFPGSSARTSAPASSQVGAPASPKAVTGGAPPSSGTPRSTSSAPTAPGTPASALPGGESAARHEAPPAPPHPSVDRRAVTFGFGVPLKTRRTPDAATGTSTPPLKKRVASRQSSPWAALGASDEGRRAADAAQIGRKPTRSCGCAGRCSHRGGA